MSIDRSNADVPTVVVVVSAFTLEQTGPLRAWLSEPSVSDYVYTSIAGTLTRSIPRCHRESPRSRVPVRGKRRYLYFVTSSDWYIERRRERASLSSFSVDSRTVIRYAHFCPSSVSFFANVPQTSSGIACVCQRNSATAIPRSTT